jgi:hypothetical protein
MALRVPVDVAQERAGAGEQVSAVLLVAEGGYKGEARLCAQLLAKVSVELGRGRCFVQDLDPHGQGATCSECDQRPASAELQRRHVACQCRSSSPACWRRRGACGGSWWLGRRLRIPRGDLRNTNESELGKLRKENFDLRAAELDPDRPE